MKQFEKRKFIETHLSNEKQTSFLSTCHVSDVSLVLNKMEMVPAVLEHMSSRGYREVKNLLEHSMLSV